MFSGRRSLNERVDDPNHFPWDRLPNDVLEIILGKLCTGDRVRHRLVCKSWNHILLQSHIPTTLEAPWEILSDESYNNPQAYLTQLCFRSLSEDRTYRFNLPTLSAFDNNRGWLCAHSRGWLVLAMGHNLNPVILLWNPLSGATRKLPPLSTLPFFEEFSKRKIQNFSAAISRVEILSVGSVDCLVAALFHTLRGNRIALCTPHESKWIPFNVEKEDEKEGIKFVDILFHTVERKLMVLARNTFSTNLAAENFKLKKFEVALMDCQVQVVPLLVPRSEIIYSQRLGFQINIPRTTWHLVESPITHSILYVAAKLEYFECIHRGEGIIPDFNCGQTTKLTVYDLDFKQDADCKKEAIFIGATGSFLLPVAHGIVPCCIYFAIDEAGGSYMQGNNSEAYVIRESGQYFLTREKKRFRRNFSKTIRYPPASKIGWFIPQLFMR